jgi:glutamate-1-semialdehyde 2,1-aminomutase
VNETEHYEQIDLPFYREYIAPLLPEEVLDFHAHTWEGDQLKSVPWKTDAAGGKYMVTWEQYGIERLASDGKKIFPDRPFNAVCFGYPSPGADIEKTNDYVSRAGSMRGVYPLLITGRGIHKKRELERLFCEGIFFGFKVLLNWLGDDYGEVRIEDMIGSGEMELADELGLVVLLHVPGSGRLADPAVQKGIKSYAERYPKAQIVLAHCGRCYHPDTMRASISSIKNIPNVYLDTSMVMDPTVFQMVVDSIDSRRLLFGTDLPVAAMRGRRVYIMDHWVDVVHRGYPPSAYRVGTDEIRATYMVYEIILAIRRAGEISGLKDKDMMGIFYRNGMSVLRNVMGGKQLEKKGVLFFDKTFNSEHK